LDLNSLIRKFLSFFTSSILFLLVCLILYDALSRYLFSSGSVALQELEWHFFDVVILLSIAYTFRVNAHVRVDIFYEKYSKKMQNLVDILAIIFFILPFSMLIIYVGFEFVELSFIQNEASSDPGGLSNRWIVKSLMPLAFIFLALEATSMLMQKIKERKTL
jgi:TRAP-type mannitol/chloroaromatic compound transport system permease small subunit